MKRTEQTTCQPVTCGEGTLAAGSSEALSGPGWSWVSGSEQSGGAMSAGELGQRRVSRVSRGDGIGRIGSHQNLVNDERWMILAAGDARPQRLLRASTSTKDPALPDTYYLGRRAARNTIETVPEKTLLAFVDDGGPVELMQPDHAAAQAYIAEVAAAGTDVDPLGEIATAPRRSRL